MRSLWAALILVLFASLLLMPGGSQGAKDDTIVVRLDLHFDEKNRGHADISMGNVYPAGLSRCEEVPFSAYPYRNDNMDRVLRSFRSGGTGNGSLFRMFLDGDGALELEDTVFSKKVERNIFVFRMETNFTYDSKGIDTEYEYFRIIKKLDDLLTRHKNESLINYNLRRLSELGRIDPRLNIELSDGLSMTTVPGLSGHKRSMSSERISQNLDANQLTSGSNRLKVFDHALLTPGFALFSTALYTLIGIGLLSYIWYRERFKGFGLILPIIALLSGIFMFINYLVPSINFHSLGSATIWLWGTLFLGLVAACNNFNPSMKYRSYDEEMEKQPRLKMPKVVYVDRQVFVEKKVRMSEEEALDPYEVLEVSERATFEEVEKAYKSKVKEYHPDKFDGTPKRIHEAARKETERLNIAYEKLKRKYQR